MFHPNNNKEKEQESTSSVNENEQCLDGRKEDVKPKKKVTIEKDSKLIQR